MLTIQQAAYEILTQAGSSLKSIEIARRIIEQQLIESAAKNPVQSISQALERNIRMNKGNTPKLQFIESIHGREIDLVHREPLQTAHEEVEIVEKKVEAEDEITIKLPKSLVDKVKIYQLGTGLPSVDDAFAVLLRSGLTSNSSELIEVLKKEMENL